MSFCPLRSTAEKEIACNSCCKWNVSRTNYQEQCGLIMYLSIMASKMSLISENMDVMSDDIAQISDDISEISKTIDSIDTYTESIENSVAKLAGY